MKILIIQYSGILMDGYPHLVFRVKAQILKFLFLTYMTEFPDIYDQILVNFKIFSRFQNKDFFLHLGIQ